MNFKKNNPVKILIKYMLILIKEIYKNSYIHIKRIIKKQSSPHIFEIIIPSNNPLILTMMANYITLTPGTITIDIKNNTLFVLDIDSNQDINATKNKIINDYNKIFL